MSKLPADKIVEETQILKDNFLHIEQNQDPKYVRNFFLSNLFKRSFSYLVGRSSIGSLLLQCTAAGILKTADTGTGFEDNECFRGTATDAAVAVGPFAAAVSRLDIWIENNGLTIERSKDGLVYQPFIELEQDSFYSFDASTLDIKVKNTDAGSDAVYQIVGWR